MPNVKARDADGNEVFYYSSQANSAGSPAKSAENVETAINTTNAALGATADAAANSDTGSFSLLSFAKRLQQRLTTLLDRLPTLTVTSTRLLVDGSGVTQPVSGTVTANTGLSQPLTDTQLRATPVPVSGTVTANLGTLNGTATETTLSTLSAKVPSNLTVTSTRLLVDGSGVTQPVSGTVTANTGLSQPLTDTQLRATPVPVSGTVTADTGLSQPLTDTQLRASAILVTPALSSSGNTSAQTAATGTNWTAFSSQALKQLTISNQTGATLEFRQDGAGVGFQVPTANFYTFFGLTNANQLEVRRVDTSNTQVTVTARWES